ncbi:STAS domain-containing protein [Cryptosporangium arvum]|uniref:Anti-anti-sigma regulatory factor (Antagonist of anti-sigma factor) n=1 Tax=Cryptosporangium arvum DSM 44712 TaxID=927661 RepID=A0A010ZQ36_9ACTN|nr:STAS domain-containing protein [Cryptosporangium arvum]EXG79307.1 anti-anti-sigma regulatory factor (antagonist of anti-sigma factor) [Cryptosporangium arvum DSM 44712]
MTGRSPIAQDESTGWDSAGQLRCEPSRFGYRIVLVGEVDLTMSQEWEPIFGVLSDGEPSDVTVDLSAATFIDSSVLGAFVRLHRTVSARGAELTMTGAEGSVLRTISLAGIDRLIPIVPVLET